MHAVARFRNAWPRLVTPTAGSTRIVCRWFSTAPNIARSVINRLPASFWRGGTSNGLLINRKDLPEDRTAWQPILSRVMGSPDSYGRQLNGMGSGISSISKVCVVSQSNREDADIDYTFVQVGIEDGSLDMAGNCGNMSSAVGPFAVDSGLLYDLVPRRGHQYFPTDHDLSVRLWNTNTSKILHSTFSVGSVVTFDEVLDKADYEPIGDYSIDGVPGTGSRITLSFLEPGGAKTGKSLPTGNPVDTIQLSNGERVRATLADIANPGVFVLAADLGVAGNITPESLTANAALMSHLEELRREGARMMGLDPEVQSIPKIVLLSRPSEEEAARGVNIVCRALSMQQAHKAVPLTLALNLGAACKLPGTLPSAVAVNAEGKESITIAHASGKLEVGSVMKEGEIESALLHRTARCLMKGEVFYDTAE